MQILTEDTIDMIAIGTWTAITNQTKTYSFHECFCKSLSRW